MKISEKKRAQAYLAIGKTIMDLRVKIVQEQNNLSPMDIDEKLFNLEIKIWEELTKVLGIED